MLLAATVDQEPAVAPHLLTGLRDAAATLDARLLAGAAAAAQRPAAAVSDRAAGTAQLFARERHALLATMIFALEPRGTAAAVDRIARALGGHATALGALSDARSGLLRIGGRSRRAAMRVAEQAPRAAPAVLRATAAIRCGAALVAQVGARLRCAARTVQRHRVAHQTCLAFTAVQPASAAVWTDAAAARIAAAARLAVAATSRAHVANLVAAALPARHGHATRVRDRAAFAVRALAELASDDAALASGLTDQARAAHAAGQRATTTVRDLPADDPGRFASRGRAGMYGGRSSS